jgi:hypothetical protein
MIAGCPGNTPNSNSSSAIGALAKVRHFLVFNLWHPGRILRFFHPKIRISECLILRLVGLEIPIIEGGGDAGSIRVDMYSNFR